MPGKFFDEWQVGDRITHLPSRTVTETDNLMFSAMTHNMQPLHLDAEYAKASEFGQILVNSTFTLQSSSRTIDRRHDGRHAGRQPRL
jgi:acyl dehydratase